MLSVLSYILRPFRNGIYLKVLQKAYELQGVKFLGQIGYIHYDAYIDNVGQIELGKNVVISTKAIILSHDHSPKVRILANGCGEYNPYSYVRIGSNSFIGAGAIVLPGTIIGDYCIIGAGAVVKGCIPSYSIVVGNPAKIIKSTKEQYELSFNNL